MLTAVEVDREVVRDGRVRLPENAIQDRFIARALVHVSIQPLSRASRQRDTRSALLPRETRDATVPGLACRRAGISRSHYYEIKEAFEKFGAEGLAEQPRRAPRMPNQTPPELEVKILAMTERCPTRSYERHGLTLRFQRLLWLEQKTAAAGGVLTEAQIRLLRRHELFLAI